MQNDLRQLGVICERINSVKINIIIINNFNNYLIFFNVIIIILTWNRSLKTIMMYNNNVLLF